MSNEVKETKAVRQKIDYAKVKEVMLQNVRKTKTKTFTRYTKELVKQYTQNPYNNIDTLREISAFLARNSMIYKKILSYFSQMPLFYYNIVYKSDFTKGIDYQKFIKSYNDVSLKLQQINMQREFSKVIATDTYMMVTEMDFLFMHLSQNIVRYLLLLAMENMLFTWMPIILTKEITKNMYKALIMELTAYGIKSS